MTSAFLDRPDLNQRLGFRYAYRQVLEDLRSKTLTTGCYEGKLEDSLRNGLEMVESNHIEILNESEDALEAEDDIKIVDMKMIIGGPVERKKGDLLKLEKMNLPKFGDFFNLYTLYMPLNPEDDMMPLTCEIIV